MSTWCDTGKQKMTMTSICCSNFMVNVLSISDLIRPHHLLWSVIFYLKSRSLRGTPITKQVWCSSIISKSLSNVVHRGLREDGRGEVPISPLSLHFSSSWHFHAHQQLCDPCHPFSGCYHVWHLPRLLVSLLAHQHLSECSLRLVIVPQSSAHVDKLPAHRS